MTTALSSRQEVRTHLGERHYEVLTALLSGVVPAGFEPRTTAVTGLVLRRKRWRAAVGVLPVLPGEPGAVDRFDAYARARRKTGCTHEDVAAFLDWALADGWTAAQQLLRYWQVDQGRRAVARVRLSGRTLLVIGIGSRFYEIPLGGAR